VGFRRVYRIIGIDSSAENIHEDDAVRIRRLSGKQIGPINCAVTRPPAEVPPQVRSLATRPPCRAALLARPFSKTAADAVK
jgi:hypothetical protein